MAQVPWKQLMPEQPKDYQMPFWYSSLQSFWLYYPARRDLVESLLPELPAGHGLRLAEFDDLGDSALVSLDFQAYTSGGTADGHSFLGCTREIEFNVYVYPESRLPSVPRMSVRDYLLGRDQTKTVGGFRLHVPCDNPIAVKAGKANFGEPKWSAAFDYQVPSPNAGGGTRWRYAVYEPQPEGTPANTPLSPSAMIFQVDADFHNLLSEPSNLSPLIEYGTRSLDGRDVVAANFWNFFGWFDTYFLSEEEGGRRVDLTMGPAIDHHRLHEDVRTVIGTQAPLAAQTFASAPVSSESQAWLEFPDD
jgi:hypothetical protein